MNSIDLSTTRLVVDPAAAADLRATLGKDAQGGLKQVAQQFEGMLLHLMLKSMRDASGSSGLLDSDQSRFFTAIGDQQMALNLASQMPIGLAGLIAQQAGRQGEGTAVSPLVALQESLRAQRAATAAAAQYSAAGARRNTASPAIGGASAEGSAIAPRDFVEQVWPHAVEAAATTGVPPHFLVAQSALETGWGKHEIRNPDGSQSFNLFGIKAGRSWSGPTVEVRTSEFVDGVAQAERARFRVYASYAEAFRDYAKLLSSKARFSGVIGQQDPAQFARSLQEAGYATDPMYADKITRIISGETLRQALSG